MRIFDTHAHYDSRQFNGDRDKLLQALHGGINPDDITGNTSEETLVENDARESLGVCGCTGRGVPVKRIVNVGADMASTRTTLELAGQYDFIYAATGVHPDSAGELIWCPEKCLKDERELNNTENNLAVENNVEDTEEEDPYKGITEEICTSNREELRNLASQEKVVSIGEIGLDYHWDIWPRDVQKEAFRWQWNLAAELNLPVIIHSRDAAEDTLNMIREFYMESTGNDVSYESLSGGRRQERPGFPRAVMHCYSYSPEHAAEYLKMGLMFGIGGVVTFKNAKKLKEVVDMLPMDRILLETDCPYMAPDPFRGKRNNSGYLTYVAGKIAEIKGMDVEEVYTKTWENAERFFARKGNTYGNTRGSEKNDRNT